MDQVIGDGDEVAFLPPYRGMSEDRGGLQRFLSFAGFGSAFN
jgi:hypothetical protein